MGGSLSCSRLAGIAAFTLLSNVVPTEAQEDVDQLSIHVRIYNIAQIPKPQMTNARTVAENVLRRACIHVLWQECTPTQEAGDRSLVCDSDLKQTDIAVNLIPHLENLSPRLHL